MPRSFFLYVSPETNSEQRLWCENELLHTKKKCDTEELSKASFHLRVVFQRGPSRKKICHIIISHSKCNHKSQKLRSSSTYLSFNHRRRRRLFFGVFVVVLCVVRIKYNTIICKLVIEDNTRRFMRPAFMWTAKKLETCTHCFSFRRPILDPTSAHRIPTASRNLLSSHFARTSFRSTPEFECEWAFPSDELFYYSMTCTQARAALTTSVFVGKKRQRTESRRGGINGILHEATFVHTNNNNNA